MAFVRVVFSFLVAVMVLTVLAVTAQSVFVVLGLNDVGARWEWGPVLTMIGADMQGLGPVYGPLIAIGLLVAFLAAAVLNRLIGGMRSLIFACAGAVCIGVMLMLMQEVFFGVQLIAGARSLPGFVFQMLAGLIGGFVFAQMTPKPANQV